MKYFVTTYFRPVENPVLAGYNHDGDSHCGQHS
jgi:hypothetical protein